jgi:tryptophan synthase alpha chain
VNGPDRIGAAFQRAGDEGRAALTVFLAAGDPDYPATHELARAAVSAGADIIELGSPFSDPLADGPVIQAAYTRALAGGASTAGTLACAASVAEATGAPVVLMVALNCVLAYGTERFCHDAALASVSGLLVPDLPVDDAADLKDAARRAGVATVFLAGPDSPPDRVAAAAAASTGFVYLMRRRGITGAGPGAVDLRHRVEVARAAATAPVAVGFGIATPADAAEMADLADGVIVGSVLVEAAYEAGGQGPEVVGDRVRSLRDALRRPESSNSTRPAAAGTGGAV